MLKDVKGATLAGFIAILLWSSSVALTRSLSEKLGPLGTGAWVFGLSGALLLVFDLNRKSDEIRVWFRGMRLRYVLGCGGIFLLYALAYHLAIGLAHDRHQAVELALLNYLWPALTILFSLFVLPMHASWGLYPGIGISLAGVFLVMTTGSTVSWQSFSGNVAGNPVAYGAALAAGVTWALYSVLIRRWAQPLGGSLSLFLLASSLILGLAAAVFPFRTAPATPALFLELGFMAVANAAAYGLWDLSMRHGKVVRVAAASYFTPVLSTLFSCAYLRISPEPRIWIGSAIVAIGSLMCWLSVREKAS